MSITYAIDAHWMRLATDGELTPHAPRQALGLTLMWWWPGLISNAFSWFAPARYDTWGLLWALAFALSVLLGPELGPRGAQALGLLEPAPVELASALSEEARRLLIRPPSVAVLSSPRVFAGVVWPNRMVLSSGSVEQLATHELVALASSELGWLQSSTLARGWARLRTAAFAVIPMACVPAFPEAPWAGVLLAASAYAYLVELGRISSPVSGRSSLPHARVALPKSARYPLALERAHQCNWLPMVHEGEERSLYDLRVEAGPAPEYPRPRPASQRGSGLAASFGFALAVLIVKMLPASLRILLSL
jgi:hypothetical protein